MPFELKNAGETFSRTVKATLGDQLGRNAAAYIDKIVIKSVLEEDHVKDLAKTFAHL